MFWDVAGDRRGQAESDSSLDDIDESPDSSLSGHPDSLQIQHATAAAAAAESMQEHEQPSSSTAGSSSSSDADTLLRDIADSMAGNSSSSSLSEQPNHASSSSPESSTTSPSGKRIRVDDGSPWVQQVYWLPQRDDADPVVTSHYRRILSFTAGNLQPLVPGGCG